jgi:hypothetical protein
MAVRNNIGKTLYVSATLPTANTATAFAALTWTKVEGLVSGPQLGVTHANIDVPDLQTGFTKGVKGAGQGQDSQMAFTIDGSDPGRTIVKDAANGGQGLLAIKLVTGSGANQQPVSGDPVQYAQGYVHSYTENQATTDSYEGFTVNFKQNAQTVDATQP